MLSNKPFIPLRAKLAADAAHRLARQAFSIALGGVLLADLQAARRKVLEARERRNRKARDKRRVARDKVRQGDLIRELGIGELISREA